MFYLYLKTHARTNVKFLGQTQQDPYKYLGSGPHWLRHLRTYGSHEIETEILWVGEDRNEMSVVGARFAKMFNVVASGEFANAEVNSQSDQSGNAEWLTRRQLPSVKEQRRNIALGNTNTRGKKWWYNAELDKKTRAEDSPGVGWVNKCPTQITPEGRKKISESSSRPNTEEHNRNISIGKFGRPNNNKGTIWIVNDVTGQRKRIQPDTPLPAGYTTLKEINATKKRDDI